MLPQTEEMACASGSNFLTPLNALFAYLFLKVPCYAFDSDGKKHDLNPLIKLSDGYLVDDPDDEIDFYINICRSLSELL